MWNKIRNEVDFLVDKVFISNVFEFLKLSFGLSIKSTHEIEWSKVT